MGLRISKKQSGQVVVVDVIPGTPAQVSGQVHAGDVVEQADGQSPQAPVGHMQNVPLAGWQRQWSLD